MRAERILILGGSGSGKTTLATRIGERSGLPVFHLDEIAREGGGRGAERSAQQRRASVAAIIADQRWIAEGIHLQWTEPLLEAADTIVWLDQLGLARSGPRVVKRFVTQALAEARRRRGRERFLRLGDYRRRLGELTASIPEMRVYHRSSAHGRDSRPTAGPTRAATVAALRPYRDKLIHCRSEADVEAALDRVTGA